MPDIRADNFSASMLFVTSHITARVTDSSGHFDDRGSKAHVGAGSLPTSGGYSLSPIAAAGHDRCIINLKPEHVESWLTPQGRSTAELQSLLSDRAIPVFQHEILKAA
jgi:hypothetical protein